VLCNSSHAEPLWRSVGDRADVAHGTFYSPRMPRYAFNTHHGERSEQSVTSDCLDDDAAQRETAGMFGDTARGIAIELQSNPKWQIEVADEAGKIIFRLRVIAEYPN
jgi:hypothetical protein